MGCKGRQATQDVPGKGQMEYLSSLFVIDQSIISVRVATLEQRRKSSRTAIR